MLKPSMVRVEGGAKKKVAIQTSSEAWSQEGGEQMKKYQCMSHLQSLDQFAISLLSFKIIQNRNWVDDKMSKITF